MKLRIFVFVPIALALLLSVAPAAAQNKKARAADAYDEGVSALESHEYKVALAAFERAYELMPHWRVLAHIGTCYAKLNRPVDSIRTLERYIGEGAGAVGEEERRIARELIVEQRRKVGELSLHVRHRGAEVKIDGESVGRTPLAPQLLLVGPHSIMVLLKKGVEERDVEVSAGSQVSIWIPEEDAPAALAPVAPIPVVGLQGEPSSEELESMGPPVQEDSQARPEEGVSVDTEIDLMSENTPRVSGTSIPFYTALVIAGAGIVTSAVGFGVYGYMKSSEQNYRDNLTTPPEGYAFADENGEFSHERCWDENRPGGVASELEVYYCDNDFNMRDYEDRAKNGVVPIVIGSSVAVLGAASAILFYFNRQWFGRDDGEVAVSLAPYGDANQSGLILNGTF